MRLSPGQQAPYFALTDVYQRPVELTAYAGKNVLLSFYRAAVCPLCNVRFLHLLEQEDAYRRLGLYQVAFFDCSAESVHHYFDRYDSSVPIIADYERVVYSQYGLETSLRGVLRGRLIRGKLYREAARRRIGGNTLQSILQAEGSLTRLPAEFLIGPDLRIYTAHYARDIGDFLSLSTIEKFLAG